LEEEETLGKYSWPVKRKDEKLKGLFALYTGSEMIPEVALRLYDVSSHLSFLEPLSSDSL
jgi:hypothetical protein